ncbi:hypothetical protein [Paraburkholderia caledonica]|uniref:PA14 domain-containing protein n=1 Tax=Paraburkholderia caledonica TaxID=134536 RepID=A0AB73INY8_9BURK|nr:hypothetical protein [Paraburkholderia caledonica]
MTTLVPLTINTTISPPFSALFTLDGEVYSGSALWNITAQRFYFQLQDQGGNVVWNGALVGSPTGFDIELAPGVFTRSTILYREDTGNFEVTP